MRNTTGGERGIKMIHITATLTFTLNPDNPLMRKTWDHILQKDDQEFNDKIHSLILIEPGFGLSLESVEDAEITKVEL